MSDVTVSEVARRADVSPGTLRRWVREGIVPPPAALIRVYGQALAAIADGEVKLKGFDEPTELFLARRP